MPFRKANDGAANTFEQFGGRRPSLQKHHLAIVPESQTLFAAMSTQPTELRKAQINTLITALKSSGVWQKLDTLWICAAHDEQAGRLNWVSPSTFTLTAVNSPTFTTDRGFAGNGTTSYLNTGYVPSTAGLLYTLDSAHISFWSRTNTGSSSMVSMGARTLSTAAQTLINARLGTNTATFRTNQDAVGASPASTTSIGHFLARRSGAALNSLWKDGALFAQDTQSSTALTAFAITLGALNTAGVVASFDTRQIAASSIGASLTDTEIINFYAALNAYMISVGAA